MIKKTLTLSLLLFLFVSCSGEKLPLLKDLVGLRKTIQDRFEVKNVRISIHDGHHLAIGLVNSKFGPLDPDERKTKAREIAVFAYNKLENKAILDTVHVSFAIYKRYFLIYGYTDNLASYRFKASALSETSISQAAIKPDGPE